MWVGASWIFKILLNVLHGRSNILLRRHVPTLCYIHNHLSELTPEIYFGLLYFIAFEFENDMYLSKRNF